MKPHIALITGATGFVGYHLTKKLLAEGWNIHLLVRQSSNTQKLKTLLPPPVLHVCDEDMKELVKIMEMVNPEIVFHLATQFTTTDEPNQIESLIRSNILFGARLLEAMKEAQVRYFVNAGTYWQHYKGKDYNPVDFYAATKQAFEDILYCYTLATDIRVVTLKLFDVFGPEDTRNKLFNLLEKTDQTGEALAMTPGEQYLDLVYIDDVVSAFRHTAELLFSGKVSSPGESYAVSSGRHIRLKEVVRTYDRIKGKRLNIQWGAKPYRKREVMKPWKGKSLPGWKALVDLETGIRLMLDTARNKSNNSTSDSCCQHQGLSYVST